MTAEVLRFAGVSLRRGPKTILDQVSWRVAEGEHWVMLGPNGAGKTTVLEIAAARLHPSSGAVWLLGERLGRVDVFDLRPRIGFASAALATRIPPTERVDDAVVTGAYGITGRWRERYEEADRVRAGDLMAAFGVEGLADRTFGTLSEGERKRVQIARALMADPELLLLDEPSAGLDLGGREELVAALAELAGDPRSPVMVLVTHHLEEIPPGFTHAALMRGGQFTAQGPLALTLADHTVSEAFGLPLRVARTGERWSATGTGPGAAPGAGTGAGPGTGPPSRRA
ncbi:MAG: ABC transporter ATP-binding protein [Bifidobacteriaceae bacterium]|jgi:iron complex transport system ATP-binding protein|nr:ABC transporter ATP-binding protein [Bifidobacteriaceae bacterium]